MQPVQLLLMALVSSLLLLLNACSVGQGGGVYGGYSTGNTRVASHQERIYSSGNGRYKQKVDSLPAAPKDISRIPNAEPKPEPKSKQGNASSYVVFGETYRVLPNSRGFTQTGTASWYGNKFHGHLTSNGEIYDMYAMSAAHTSLPLPTYLRVTNLANNRQVIVRVNDRGPFIGNRILDLSYAAAAKLDMLKSGTARVKIQAIDPVAWQAQQRAKQKRQLASAGPAYLQVAALGSQEAAQKLQVRLQQLTRHPTRIVTDSTGKNLFRVQLGPLAEEAIQPTLEQLEATELGRPLVMRY